MKEILMLATIIMPIATGLSEAIKRAIGINKRYVPIASVVIGVALGALAVPFTDLDVASRLWAGGLAGLSATGLYELGKQSKPRKQK